MAESEAAVCNRAILKLGSNGELIGSLEDDTPMAEACKLVYADLRDELLRAFDKWGFANRRGYPTQLGGDTWSATKATYAVGDFVSYAPSADNVVNPPESVSTFVYMALRAGAQNLGLAPDSNPAAWSLVSRAAWAYVFLPPSDCLKILGLYGGRRNGREDLEIPYELGSVQITQADGSLLGPGTVLYTDSGLPWEVLSQSTNPASIELKYTGRVTDPKQFPSDFTEALAFRLASELALGIRKDPALAAKMYAAYTAKLDEATAAALRERRDDPPPLPSYIAARGSRRRGR